MSWQTIIKENNLDISVVPLSELFGRIDAEYYRPKYLRDDKRLYQHPIIPLGDFCYVTDGQHGYHEEDPASKIRFLTAKNARNWFADGENVVRVAKWVDEKNKRSSLKVKDLILSTRGTVGLCAIVGAEILPSQIDQDVARICINTGADILPEFLLTYLNSEYGQDWMIRNSTGNVQQGLSLDKVRAIPIPKATRHLQQFISEVVLKANSKKTASEKAYNEAEQLLLNEISLEGYKGTDEAISVRNFSEASADNRFDAEYWQPDYDVIFDTLSKYKKGLSTIGNEFKQQKGNFKAEKDKEYNYVEIGDVNVSTGEVESNVIIGAELPANAKIKFGKRQLITSKVRPNRGATAILNNHEDYIGSGAFTVLTEQENINLETLMVYLKARPIRELLLRYNTGTSYPVIIDSDVLKLPIPLIDKAVQKKISELVSVSAKERQEAKVLLEKAKRAVEIFIQENEKEAIKYLNL